MPDLDEAKYHDELRSSLQLMTHLLGFDERLPASGKADSGNSADASRPRKSGDRDFMLEEHQDGIHGFHNAGNLNHIVDDGKGKQTVYDGSQEMQHSHVPRKRPFCYRCEKAQNLCICSRFKGIVHNKVKVTVLQNPKEKQHAVGSVRVALLGLKNVALVGVPELQTTDSFRVRPKIHGSKRSLAGRGGKKLLLNGGKVSQVVNEEVPADAEVLRVRNLLHDIFKHDRLHHPLPSSEDVNGFPDKLLYRTSLAGVKSTSFGGNCMCGGKLKGERGFNDNKEPLCIEELESLIPPGVVLLYPSDKAVELPKKFSRNNGNELEAPCHLLVLDGTWSKARRIYLENPWLYSLPHYKLSPASPSRYEGVRKQPKPSCLSTLESIVYVLKVLEPENAEGLDGLLEVFDSMVEDQRQCKQMKQCLQDSET